MIILGINDGHHASAAVLRDGELVCAVAEERFTRIKGEHGYPRHAIEACLSMAGIGRSEIDRVAVATRDLPPVYFLIRRDSDFSVRDYWREQTEYWYPVLYGGKKISYLDVFKEKADWSKFQYDRSLIRDLLDIDGMRAARIKLIGSSLGIAESTINFFDHHACHAYFGSAAAPAHDGRSLIFTADGFGDGANGSIWSGRRGERLDRIIKTDRCHIGRMYRYATLLLGMKPAEHEYKVMGLAPYANERYGEYPYQVYAETLQVDGLDFSYKVKPKDNFFYFKEKLDGSRFDSIAYAIQRRTEELITEWICNGIRQTGISDVIFSGGVAQNIKANKRVCEIPAVTDFFVPPAAHDESLSIGAAYMDYIENVNGTAQLENFPGAYLGTSYDDDAIEKVISAHKNWGDICIGKATTDTITDILAKGGVVARFSGRMEFGARALGNRSIIGDPRNPSVVKVINDQIKSRDFWMPFAPSVKEERAADYFVNPKNIRSKYMTVAFDTTPLAREDLSAAIHPYDATARPNIVSKSDNPAYHDIISAFEARTGVGGVLNTSFNLHGEPIVESPQDAISTFLRSGLKNLALGGFLLAKR